MLSGWSECTHSHLLLVQTHGLFCFSQCWLVFDAAERERSDRFGCVKYQPMFETKKSYNYFLSSGGRNWFDG